VTRRFEFPNFNSVPLEQRGQGGARETRAITTDKGFIIFKVLIQ
jgi:hypothetical protein